MKYMGILLKPPVGNGVDVVFPDFAALEIHVGEGQDLDKTVGQALTVHMLSEQPEPDFGPSIVKCLKYVEKNEDVKSRLIELRDFGAIPL